MTTPPIVPVAEPIAQAAASVGMSVDFLRKEVHAGRLHAKLVGGKYLVGRTDLQDWFDRQVQAS